MRHSIFFLSLFFRVGALRLGAHAARSCRDAVARPAGLVAFLCSPAAAYITGQCIGVDGGYSVRGWW